MISDAQAAVLAVVADYEAQGIELYWLPAEDYLGATVIGYERIDREADVAGWIMWSQGDVRGRSIESCIRHGWLTTPHETVVAIAGQEHETIRQLTLTEDGVIELGRWRERKLHAPPVPIPMLDGKDREVVEVATRAMALGYCLVPLTPSARQEARRLARTGWARRGSVGATRAIVPTGLAQVEVAPDHADTPGG